MGDVFSLGGARGFFGEGQKPRKEDSSPLDEIILVRLRRMHEEKGPESFSLLEFQEPSRGFYTLFL